MLKIQTQDSRLIISQCGSDSVRNGDRAMKWTSIVGVLALSYACSFSVVILTNYNITQKWKEDKRKSISLQFHSPMRHLICNLHFTMFQLHSELIFMHIQNHKTCIAQEGGSRITCLTSNNSFTPEKIVDHFVCIWKCVLHLSTAFHLNSRLFCTHRSNCFMQTKRHNNNPKIKSTHFHITYYYKRLLEINTSDNNECNHPFFFSIFSTLFQRYVVAKEKRRKDCDWFKRKQFRSV